MARPLRIERPGGRYHVTSRGNNRKLIYRDATDRCHLLPLVGEPGQLAGGWITRRCPKGSDDSPRAWIEIRPSNGS
jgi:hypothetical protein